MNICFICNEYPPLKNGGIGTFTKELSENIVKKGHQAIVIGYYEDIENDLSETINNVHVIKLSLPFKNEVLARIKLYKKILELHRLYSIDILECQEYGGLTAFWPYIPFKLIIRLHGSVVYFRKELNQWSMKNLIWLLLEKSTLNKADEIVSVSKYTAEKTEKYFKLKKHITVIYNGVEKSPYTKNTFDKNKGIKAIFAGSLIEKKGFFSLAIAWNRFVKESPESMLYIAGKNNFNELEKFLNIIENKKSVKYLGVLKKDDLLKNYSEKDVSIFPSFVEAFSLAPMEAMSVGMPVIYSLLSSGRELIEDGVNGFLVNPKNPNTVFDALISFEQMNQQKREAIGKSGQKRIFMNFTLSKTVEKNLEFYNKVLNES